MRVCLSQDVDQPRMLSDLSLDFAFLVDLYRAKGLVLDEIPVPGVQR